MARIEKAEAIVLKSNKYGDTSKIINLYTREFGKLSVIAKGSRSKNNRFGGSLEPLSHIGIVFYNYENRELQYITQSSIINFFPAIHSDFAKMTASLAMAEIVNNVLHSEERNDEFFELFLNTFIAIEKSSCNFESYITYFELNLAGISGFHPEFGKCEICKTILDVNYTGLQSGFSIDRGCVFCNKCLEKNILPFRKISLEELKILQKFSTFSPGIIEDLNINPSISNELFNLINIYLKHHIPGMKNLKSLEIFSKF
jgi:DNA repair protein RecO (recombination protein O)